MSTIIKQVASSATLTSPILRDEFIAALEATLLAIGDRYKNLRWPHGAEQDASKDAIALAISGGADSMALAAMMKHYTDSDNPIRTPAFIVDHGMREESSREADHVRDILENKLDIQAEILKSKLDGNGQSPLRQGETYARALRFQLLDIALKQRGIDKIALAHHANDQHETILQRLAAGARAGLTGISAISQYGNLGHTKFNPPSGLRRFAASPSQKTVMTAASPKEETGLVDGYGNGLFAMAGPSPVNLRPLLTFPKSRLIATCKYFGIDWVEDRTNHDPTFTPRNAIRKITTQHAIPKALQLTSISSLQRTLQETSQRIQARAREILDSCELDLEFRSGILDIKIPLAEIMSPEDIKHRPLILAQLLRLCIQMVRPENGIIESKELFTKTSRISARMSELWDKATPNETVTNRKTTNKDVVLEAHSSTIQSVACSFGLCAGSGPKGRWLSWKFSRLSFEAAKVGEACELHRGSLANVLPLQLPKDETGRTATTLKDQNFHLWDGRFWIRAELQGIPPDLQGHLVIRPLTPADIARFRGMSGRADLDIVLPDLPSVRSKRGGRLLDLLHDCAPGSIRFTLPVIEYVNDEDPTLNTLLALPTLGVSFRARQDPQNLPSTVLHVRDVSSGGDFVQIRWSVRYRYIDIGNRSLRLLRTQGGPTSFPTLKVVSNASRLIF